MKSTFSTSWKSSKQPRKQRKYVKNAPKHIKNKLMSAMLSKELRTKHHKKNLPIKKGDKVKVLRGQFKGKMGKVTKVDLRNLKVNLVGVDLMKKEGTKVPYPIHPSNIMITELTLDDKKRKKALERK